MDFDRLLFCVSRHKEIPTLAITSAALPQIARSILA